MLELFAAQKTPYTAEFTALNSAENLLFILYAQKGSLTNEEEDEVRQLQSIDTDIRFTKVIKRLITLLSHNLENIKDHLLNDTKQMKPYLQEQAKIPSKDIPELPDMLENRFFEISVFADTFNTQALKIEAEKIVTFLSMINLASIANSKESYIGLSITLYTLDQYSKYSFWSLEALPSFYQEILQTFLIILNKSMTQPSLISFLSPTQQILSSELFKLAIPQKTSTQIIDIRNLLLNNAISDQWQNIIQKNQYSPEDSSIYLLLNTAKTTLNLYDKNQNKHLKARWKYLSHSWQNFYIYSGECFDQLDWCKDCSFWCCIVPVVGILMFIAILQHKYNVAASLGELLAGN